MKTLSSILAFFVVTAAVANASYFDNTKQIKKFGGEIYYVAEDGNDANVGKDPKLPKLTIGSALTDCSSGDAVSIKAGTYTETGLTVDKAAVELWFEIGSTLDPATGTALTLTAASCKVEGTFNVDVPAGEVGMSVSGAGCYVSGGTIRYGANAVRITGAGCVFRDMAAGFQTVAAYCISANQTRMFSCSTVGNANTIGYHINTNSDTGVIKGCSSVGHASSGYYISAGSDEWSLIDCSSGAGDGARVDEDLNNVWSDYTFDDHIYKTMTITTTGAQTYSLFRITGVVEIETIWADVETVISSNLTAFHLELWDGAVSTDITKNDGVISALPVGSFVVKEDKAGSTIGIASAATGTVLDEVDAKKEAFRCVQKVGGVTTLIRASGTSTDAPPSGALHWHIKWHPLSEDGFVEAAK